MKSARAGDIGAMSALLKSGANIHDQDGLVRCSLFENSDTPGWSDHVYAPPLPLYKHGQTALSHACACGRTEAARFLIENGAQFALVLSYQVLRNSDIYIYIYYLQTDI